MTIAYGVHTPVEGYLEEFDVYEGKVVWSRDITRAMLFDRLQTALIVQRFLCWVHFKGEKVVGVFPFPHNLRVEA